MNKVRKRPASLMVFNAINYMIKRTSDFSLLDWAIFKAGLISLGVLIGSLFSKFLRKLAPLVFFVFLATAVYTLWRLLVCDCDED